MKIDNLDSAMEEMFDFITDLPSGLDGFESDFDAAFSELAKVKSDNVLEVVRCKECKWWENAKDYTPYCNNLDCGLFYTARENDFCSYGERREDHKC